MNSLHILYLIVAYFIVLILISLITGKNQSNDTFFKANKQSPWYLVAFGMIGASLSGVTFISVPGWVEASHFNYMQMVFGYVIGYLIIGVVLLPLYYRLNLTSIYTYLGNRFGQKSYKTGAWYFILSRVVGSSFRLFLVANVLQLLVFNALGIPYWLTVVLTILLIWLYTFRSGIKTIIITDTLQTFFMLSAVVISIILIAQYFNLSFTGVYHTIANSKESTIFQFSDAGKGNYFWNQFLSGAFIAIVMTGLDQDMMQKNLTCKTLKDAQKNMFWFTIVLVFVNLLFLSLGILLNKYAVLNGIDAHGDQLFPSIAASGKLGILAAVFFILGLIAAAYSSADSALTALTTSFSIDILNVEAIADKNKQVNLRKRVHIAFSLVLITTIIIFKYVINDPSVISAIFRFAGYTYGPLLGLYALGLFTKIKVKDNWVPFVAILSPILTYVIQLYLNKHFHINLGYFILIVNGLITFLGLWVIKLKKQNN